MLLLAILPLSMAFASPSGGDRLPPRAASSLAITVGLGRSPDGREVPVISLAALEPVLPGRARLDAPVFLPGTCCPPTRPRSRAMGDIDQALARAYARARAGRVAVGSPPPPHFAVEPPARPRRGLVRSWTGPRPSGPWSASTATGSSAWPTPWSPPAIAIDRSLLFTSCHRAEGRTTLVLTLARALARRPGRTLLVDADLAGPMLARLLGLRPRRRPRRRDRGGRRDGRRRDRRPRRPPLGPPACGAPVARPRDFLAGPAWSDRRWPGSAATST